MKAEAEKRGIETKIWAEPLDKVADTSEIAPRRGELLAEDKWWQRSLRAS